MPFGHSLGRTSQTVQIPLCVIDAAYGRDNHDNAADDMIYCLRTASEFRDRYKTEFTFDRSHDNPWYHAMVLTIHGITESHYNRFIDLLATHKLVEASKG